MNIYDIAEMAGVSIATVSRVINHKSGVSAKAKEKVMAVIEATDFRPNQIAKSLTSKRTHVVGIVMPGINHYFSNRIDAINKVCKQRGYSLMITANYKDSNSTEEDVDNFNLLFEKRVDGIIYFPTNVMNEHMAVIERIRKEIPIVITDKELPEMQLPCVIQDFVKPVETVMNFFIGQGHKRIAFINGPSYDLPNSHRMEAYQQCLKGAGLTYDPSLVAEGGYSVDAGYKETQNMIFRNQSIPTALFAANDHMAIGAIKAIKDMGYKTPEDIAVIGYDDIEFACHVTPSLSTISVNQYNMGKIAATLVIDLIEGNVQDDYKMVMDYQLIHRESTQSKID